MSYQPPYQVTTTMLNLVAEISEKLGQWSGGNNHALSPQLRRKNRIRTIQASLAIENNTLSVEQVTAVIAGKHVLGLPQEIQEVHNAFAAYKQLENWQVNSLDDLLAAHQLLMKGLVENAGQLRSSGVGIYQGKQLVHMAPPADNVYPLMMDLLQWLEHSKEHPLLASCIFHYEFEFIHPFSDGNGRMGRLWQTLILSQWRSILAYLPVETLIKDRQTDYYQALGEADDQAEATPFIEFMLNILHDALVQALQTDLVTDPVTDQVKRLILALHNQPAKTTSELMVVLNLKHRPTFRKNYLQPALAAKWIEMTQPNTPKSPTQKYCLTQKGQLFV